MCQLTSRTRNLDNVLVRKGPTGPITQGELTKKAHKVLTRYDVVDDNVARRRFLQFVACSPYVAALGGVRVLAQRAPEIAAVMADPKEALSVMDFEEAARPKVSPQHWAFMASGVDDDAT